MTVQIRLNLLIVIQNPYYQVPLLRIEVREEHQREESTLTSGRKP